MTKGQSGSPLFKRKLFGLEPQEQLKVSLLFLFFFFVIATFWIQKPIRISKFLVAIGIATAYYLGNKFNYLTQAQGQRF